MVLTEGLSVPVIIGAAVIDSINPCAFGVLIFILAYLMKASKNKNKVLIDGFGYVVGVYITYLLLGILIFQAIGQVLAFIRETGLSEFFYQAIGVLIMAAGLLELKDFVMPDRGPSLAIMPRFAEKIKVWTKHLGKAASQNLAYGLIFSIVMGFLVALVELPCTGAPYLAVITLMSQANFTLAQAIPLMLAYNVVFVLPLLGIIFIVYKGTSTQYLMDWKNSHKIFMRLAAGILLLALGAFIFFFDVFFGG